MNLVRIAFRYRPEDDPDAFVLGQQVLKILFGSPFIDWPLFGQWINWDISLVVVPKDLARPGALELSHRQVSPST